MNVKDFLRSARASLRELLIVVFGILIAFSLEAWWNQHANRQREAAELRGLEMDLAETRQTLNRMIKHENELVASYDTLLNPS